ncbi:hypothetical protein SDJN02_12882, partial [Cucurbita argyrosperma subsp. argyrosperma]
MRQSIAGKNKDEKRLWTKAKRSLRITEEGAAIRCRPTMMNDFEEESLSQTTQCKVDPITFILLQDFWSKTRPSAVFLCFQVS